MAIEPLDLIKQHREQQRQQALFNVAERAEAQAAEPPSAQYAGTNGSTGNAVMRLATGELVEGMPIFNTMAQPGDPILIDPTAGIATADQVSAWEPEPEPEVITADEPGKVKVLYFTPDGSLWIGGHRPKPKRIGKVTFLTVDGVPIGTKANALQWNYRLQNEGDGDRYTIIRTTNTRYFSAVSGATQPDIIPDYPKNQFFIEWGKGQTTKQRTITTEEDQFFGSGFFFGTRYFTLRRYGWGWIGMEPTLRLTTDLNWRAYSGEENPPITSFLMNANQDIILGGATSNGGITRNGERPITVTRRYPYSETNSVGVGEVLSRQGWPSVLNKAGEGVWGELIRTVTDQVDIYGDEIIDSTFNGYLNSQPITPLPDVGPVFLDGGFEWDETSTNSGTLVGNTLYTIWDSYATGPLPSGAERPTYMAVNLPTVKIKLLYPHIYPLPPERVTLSTSYHP